MPSLSAEQIDIIERIVKYRHHRSMKELKRQIKELFVERGWKDALKLFKLKNAGNFEVNFYIHK